MPDIYIIGNKKLNGSLAVQGSKNAVLPILAATVLINGVSVIENCPRVSDVYASINILRHLGAKCSLHNNTLVVDTKSLSEYKVPDNLMREMRSSSLFLGAILSRMKIALVCSPGGCELGPRPIDLHIKAFKELGAEAIEQDGCTFLSAEKGLKGTKIHLAFPSVGATENIILASVYASGTTTILNAAKEPEIEDLSNFLISAGADIKGAGTDTIIINGIKELKDTRHTIIPDRIVAATYISCAAITGGDIELNSIIPRHLGSIVSIFEESGCEITENKNTLRIKAPNKLKSTSTIRTQIYPGFPTDAGPTLISALTVSEGTTVFVENIFQNRFRYIDELKRFGANIKTEGNVAVVEGINKLKSAKCESTDLRGGAAIVVAALNAEGLSVIQKTEHIKRGYEDIVRDLTSLGANIIEK